ncbi:MAG: MFS transporter [Oscillospiraceae bacterium]|nr:MFS transporter [Oscillospiraceae bacterium]
MNPTLPKKEQLAYLVALGGQVTLYYISGLLAYYFQFTLLLPPMVVSVILTANRVFDAMKDPFMGSLMDRTRTRWGKARPYLIYAPVPAALFTILCFLNGIYDPSQGVGAAGNLRIILWAVAAFFLWGLAYTAGDIPLHSLPTLMTADKQERTQLISLKTLSAVFGSMFGFILQPLALWAGAFFHGETPQHSERLGFIVVVIPITLISAAMFQLAGIIPRERVEISQRVYTIRENLRLMWRNRPFRALLLSGIFSSPRYVEGVVWLPLFSYYYANKDPVKILIYTILLSTGAYAGKLLAVKLMPALTKKYEKTQIFIFCNRVMVLPYMAVFALYLAFPTRMAEPLFVALAAIALTVAGTLGTVLGILLPLMTADAVDYEEHTNAVRPDGVFAAGQTIIAKLNGGIATLIGGIIYALVGFTGERVEALNAFIDGGGIARENQEFTPYMVTLFALFTIPAIVGALLANIPMRNYPLTDTDHDRILEELNAARARSES